MQFSEGSSTLGKCPVCGKSVPVRTTRSKKPNYCSRACASQSRYATRYQGTFSGPKDKPDTKLEKTKFNS